MSLGVFTTEQKINLSIIRCFDCGNYYAIEEGRGQNPRCPYCADRSISSAVDEMMRLDRCNRSLRGAITVLKKKVDIS